MPDTLRSALSPSMMCADLFALRDTLRVFERCGIEYLHIDVMDGVFVPNYCLGPDYCRRLREETRLPLDLHLMVVEPEKKLAYFPYGRGDIVSFHLESTENAYPAIDMIAEKGALPFLAINPDTPIERVVPYLPKLKGVLLMTVYPGFAGQKMVPGALDRIQTLRKMMDENGYGSLSIEVDGNVSFVNAPLMRNAGADLFVAGSSSVFAPGDLSENIRRMRGTLS